MYHGHSPEHLYLFYFSHVLIRYSLCNLFTSIKNSAEKAYIVSSMRYRCMVNKKSETTWIK